MNFKKLLSAVPSLDSLLELSYKALIFSRTIVAEKIETILRRGVLSTRPRDFYDSYILTTTQKFDKAVFADALNATANHRETAQQIADVELAGAAENAIAKHNAFINAYVVLQLAAVADANVVGYIDVLTKGAVFANAGTLLDVAEMPDLGALSYFNSVVHIR